MIITCPHCQTRYQIAFEAIGAAGRKVQCASCHRDWQEMPQSPEPDPAVAAVDEDAMDESFAEVAQALLDEAALAPKTKRQTKDALPNAPEDAAGGGDGAQSEAPDPADPDQDAAAVAAGDAEQTAAPGQRVDPALQLKRQKAFSQRQNSLFANLPMARFRRWARVVLVLILGGGLGFAYFGRQPMVQFFPDMAGIYAQLGMPVNVLGLDFINVGTERSLHDGKDILVVQADIINISERRLPVPPVVFTLIDTAGHSFYQWSLRAQTQGLVPGKMARITTQLALPPGDIARVQLSFAGGSASDSVPPAGGINMTPEYPPTSGISNAAQELK